MLGAVKYLLILVWEVIKAALDVMVLTLSPKAKEVQPRLVYFKSPVRSDIGKVMLSNSITLTPGTITCGVGEDLFCVHALDGKYAGGMDESVFVTEIRKLEDR
jgi:multicomponent Na+:H+ antiporter subunit E